MKQFCDEGKYEIDFANTLAIYCPKCSQQALITPHDYPWRATQVSITCRLCSYNEKWSQKKWEGPTIGYVRRRCRYCGRWLEKKIIGPKHSYEATIKCSGYD